MMDSRIQNMGVLGTGSLKVKEFCTGWVSCKDER